VNFLIDNALSPRVAAGLRAAGHDVIALTLPGLESVDADRSSVTLSDHADAMADAERSNLVLGNSRTLLEQVNAALQRLDDGTYGFCQRCGKPIGERRLEALPYALYDLECQEIVERETTL